MKLVSVALVAILLLMMIPFTSHAAPAEANSVSCTAFHIVQRGDTLYKISRDFNVTLANLLSWNNISNANYIQVGQHICVRVTTNNPPPTSRTHTVQRGETLYRIARMYGVNLTVLAQVNNISNPSRIWAGQVLRIPDVTIQ